MNHAETCLVCGAEAIYQQQLADHRRAMDAHRKEVARLAELRSHGDAGPVPLAPVRRTFSEAQRLVCVEGRCAELSARLEKVEHFLPGLRRPEEKR